MVKSGRQALHGKKNQIGLQLFALAALGVFLALGLYNPLYWVLFKAVPGFSLFRVPARWLLLYAFGAAMLAGIGLQEVSGWLETRFGESRELGRKAVVAALLTIGLSELLAGAQALPLTHPTAPGAFASLRTAPAHILAAQAGEYEASAILVVYTGL